MKQLVATESCLRNFVERRCNDRYKIVYIAGELDLWAMRIASQTLLVTYHAHVRSLEIQNEIANFQPGFSFLIHPVILIASAPKMQGVLQPNS